MNDKSLEDLKSMLEEDESKGKNSTNSKKWPGFIEATVVDFFDEHKIEKMALEDGNGNKAKLSRTKDNGIKIEYSSTVLM